MDLREIVRAILAGDLIAARQWVADAYREPVEWGTVERPHDLSDVELSVAAGIAELLASRARVAPPEWTATVGALRETVVLDPGLEQMPRSFAHAKRHAPEPLRKRNLVALPDFLDVA